MRLAEVTATALILPASIADIAGRRIDDAERHMAADQVGHHRRHAAVGHERELDPRHLVEQLGGQMHERAVAAVADGELVALAPSPAR